MKATTCDRCGGSFGGAEPWDEPVPMPPHDGRVLHYECKLREQWKEWKRILREMD